MPIEEFVRKAYEIAEPRDIPEWIACLCPEPTTPPRDTVACAIVCADGKVTG
jgi:hypothetical protein